MTANIYDQIKKNNINTWIIFTVFIALLLAIGMGFDYFLGAGFGFLKLSGLFERSVATITHSLVVGSCRI